MSARIIDGFAVAQKIHGQTALEVSSLKAKGIHPCLAVILVGENPASVSYVSAKKRRLPKRVWPINPLI